LVGGKSRRRADWAERPGYPLLARNPTSKYRALRMVHAHEVQDGNREPGTGRFHPSRLPRLGSYVSLQTDEPLPHVTSSSRDDVSLRLCDAGNAKSWGGRGRAQRAPGTPNAGGSLRSSPATRRRTLGAHFVRPQPPAGTSGATTGVSGATRSATRSRRTTRDWTSGRTTPAGLPAASPASIDGSPGRGLPVGSVTGGRTSTPTTTARTSTTRMTRCGRFVLGCCGALGEAMTPGSRLKALPHGV
jgi:hypothetical protein